MNRADSQEKRSTISEHNKADLERRRKEIQGGGLKDNYKGDFMGMQVLEGVVEIRDKRSGREKLTKLQTRIILGREIDLPITIDTQHSDYSKKNNSLLATLFFKSIALFNQNRIAILHPKDTSGHIKAGNDVLIALIEQYERINQGKEKYPLTLFYAHGYVDRSEKHIINSGATEDYPTNIVLDNLLEQYPIPQHIDKVPVLLVMCNEDGEKSSILSHPKMKIAYKEGVVGLMHGTGEATLSG